MSIQSLGVSKSTRTQKGFREIYDILNTKAKGMKSQTNLVTELGYNIGVQKYIIYCLTFEII